MKLDAVVMKLDAVCDDVKLCERRLELIQNSDAEAEAHLKEVFDNVKKNQEGISIVIIGQQEI
jgi:enoyl-[acyl-carrier-protein] reductase (NADH)